MRLADTRTVQRAAELAPADQSVVKVTLRKSKMRQPAVRRRAARRSAIFTADTPCGCRAECISPVARSTPAPPLPSRRNPVVTRARWRGRARDGSRRRSPTPTAGFAARPPSATCNTLRPRAAAKRSSASIPSSARSSASICGRDRQPRVRRRRVRRVGSGPSAARSRAENTPSARCHISDTRPRCRARPYGRPGCTRSARR